MTADSLNESGSRRPKRENEPKWNELEPALSGPKKADRLLAQLPKDAPAPAADQPQPKAPPTFEQALTKLKELEGAIAQKKPVDSAEYIAALSNVATFEMRDGKYAEAAGHFKRADKEIRDLRSKGEATDPASELNYLGMLRAYGRTILTLRNNSDYLKDPKELAKAIEDREEADRSLTTAIQLGEKHGVSPILQADLLRDRAINGAVLADDKYRPQRSGLPTDVDKWRPFVEKSIADLTSADSKLKGFPVDPRDVLNPALELRARVLSDLANMEMRRANQATDKFTINAGQHFENAIDAWGKYSPTDRQAMRSKEDNQLQLYNDYQTYLTAISTKHPDLEAQAFAVARYFQIGTEIANIRRLRTNIDR